MDSQRSKFSSTLLLVIFGLGLRLIGFGFSFGLAGHGALGASTVFIVEPLAFVRVALLDTLALVLLSKEQVDSLGKASSYSILNLEDTLLTT